MPYAWANKGRRGQAFSPSPDYGRESIQWKPSFSVNMQTIVRSKLCVPDQSDSSHQNVSYNLHKAPLHSFSLILDQSQNLLPHGCSKPPTPWPRLGTRLRRPCAAPTRRRSSPMRMSLKLSKVPPELSHLWSTSAPASLRGWRSAGRPAQRASWCNGWPILSMALMDLGILALIRSLLCSLFSPIDFAFWFYA
jgi:hypothetical protein